MEKKQTTRSSAASGSKAKAGDAGPFAAVVEPMPVKKRAAKKAVVPPAAEVKSIKSFKASKMVVLDPFAELAEVASTVKKKESKARVKTPKKAVRKTAKKALDVTAKISATEPVVELSTVFKALAEPKLPELRRENRARLQIQSPTKLYFYWSVKENPYHLLRDAFGGETGSYTLVSKLTNVGRDTEEIHTAEAEGIRWFDVEPGAEYEAEIGFYAPNRPYFRIIYSNTVETPRRTPSPRAATDADWTVSANKFAEVLDVAGFSRDAFDVAMAGDDYSASESVTHIAFSRFVGLSGHQTQGVPGEDIRYAMMALASGVKLEDLRWSISPTLFAILQANVEKLAAGKAMSALTEYFDIDEAEFSEEQFSPAVFGASLVNFPRTLKTRSLSPKFAPVSSHSYR